jgi:hypothetical protein
MSITAANRRSPATTKLGSSRATFYGWHGSTKTPATAHQHKLKYPVSRAAFIRQIKKRRVIRLGFKLAPLKRLSTLWLSKRYSACE